MRYPIVIEPGNDAQAWGVVVPDLPGCFSAADDGIDAAIANTKDAIELWIEAALDNNEKIPLPSTIAELQSRPEYQGWVWAIVEIDPALFDDTIERVNITLPRRVLARLDTKAKAAGKNRSAFIAHMALMQ
ncbi:MAG: type II toxin-antitoxin system HicB family antitoxin [Burkholderiaceae bacterium]|nr:type II toxin-antitoxin system HicB family antitoxin [Burkholderiaceae bacterium]